MTTSCEACLTRLATHTISAGEEGDAYRVCAACAERLEAGRLQPLEWYRLAALHGPMSPLLHDDLYDEDGRADQGEGTGRRKAAFAAPTLAMVANDLNALLDFVITRWQLDEPCVAALASHPAGALLDALSRLERERPIGWVSGRCYEIAACVLGPAAKAWVAARWEAGTRPDTLFSFLRAAAACLPPADAIPKAIRAVEQTGGRDLSVPGLALARFGSPLVLDWVERCVRSPVSDRWGWIAGCSGMNWSVIVRWLDAGRPLSLVALDALAAALVPSRGSRPAMLVAGVADLPDTVALLDRLRAYAMVDPAPRVTAIIDRIEAAAPLPPGR